jgi:hypothetical protein
MSQEVTEQIFRAVDQVMDGTEGVVVKPVVEELDKKLEVPAGGGGHGHAAGHEAKAHGGNHGAKDHHEAGHKPHGKDHGHAQKAHAKTASH